MSSRFFTVKRESKNDGLVAQDDQTALETEADLPPVVARLVVEIRSDGTRTVARGALEDLVSGEKVALQANGQSPAALARELTKTLLGTPALAGQLAKQAMLEMLPSSVRDSATGKFRIRPNKLRWPGKKKADD